MHGEKKNCFVFATRAPLENRGFSEWGRGSAQNNDSQHPPALSNKKKSNSSREDLFSINWAQHRTSNFSFYLLIKITCTSSELWPQHAFSRCLMCCRSCRGTQTQHVSWNSKAVFDHSDRGPCRRSAMLPNRPTVTQDNVLFFHSFLFILFSPPRSYYASQKVIGDLFAVQTVQCWSATPLVCTDRRLWAVHEAAEETIHGQVR